MTDSHFHRETYKTFLVCDDHEVAFLGIHPWESEEGRVNSEELLARVDVIRGQVAGNPKVGVGEIGLDRLKTKTISETQRELFAAQLAIAAEFHRPVVLHGAKCWGEVVQACKPYAGKIPAFLFHGFSRSAGLLPEIFALNGFVSVGPALLNDHAVNYREMVKALPLDRVLLETDRDWSVPNGSPLGEPRSVAASTEPAPPDSQEALLTSLVHTFSQLTNSPLEVLTSTLAANTARFVEALA